MKISFAILIALTASLSLAQAFAQEDASTYEISTTGHSWLCRAQGIEPSSGRNTEISGGDKPTLQEAQQSAVQRCTQLGLMACRYSTCIDEGSAH
jgi:hypothetical protein